LFYIVLHENHRSTQLFPFEVGASHITTVFDAWPCQSAWRACAYTRRPSLLRSPHPHPLPRMSDQSGARLASLRTRPVHSLPLPHSLSRTQGGSNYSRGLLASCFSFIVFFYPFSFVQMLDKFIPRVLELQKL